MLDQLSGMHWLMISLLYGSGLRRIELVRLRVKDIDFDHLQIRIWNGKSAKHRLVTLAPELADSLKTQIDKIRLYLNEDIHIEGYAGVWMPDALERKYPSAQKTLGWQYLFPSTRLSFEPGTNFLRRHHFDESNINKIIRKALLILIKKLVVTHFAIPLLLICCNRAQISEQYRSSLGIRM